MIHSPQVYVSMQYPIHLFSLTCSYHKMSSPEHMHARNTHALQFLSSQTVVFHITQQFIWKVFVHDFAQKSGRHVNRLSALDLNSDNFKYSLAV